MFNKKEILFKRRDQKSSEGRFCVNRADLEVMKNVINSTLLLLIVNIKIFLFFFKMYDLEKNLKVGKVVRHNFASIRPYIAPIVRISGHWFRRLGFKSGDYVKVIATKDCIILKPIKL